MRPFLPPLALAAALVPWWAAAEDRPPAAPTASDRDVQDLVFLGGERPVLIRLHVRVDGQPFRDAFEAAWGDYLKHLFRALDRDGDGFLSPEEAARAPAPPLILPGDGSAGQLGSVHFAFNFAVLDADGDGRVSPGELAAYYREYGGGALHSQFASRPAPLPPAVNASLFERLDQNKDGKLSKEELAAAASTLFRLDLDGDELLTPQELLGSPTPTNPAPAAPAASGTTLPQGSAFFVVTGSESFPELGRRIVTRYGSGLRNGQTLSRQDVRLDDPTFDRLDTNRDGRLDAGELARFTQRPADIELIVRLGKTAPGEAPLDVFAPNGTPAPLAANVRTTPEGVLIRLGDTLVELCRNEGKLRVVPGDRPFYRELFRAADTNRRGHLDRASARAHPFLAAFHDVMDRNGDGNVDEKEFLTYLDEVHERLARALSARVALLVSDEGQGLFDLLDGNRDGRLGLRELRDAPKVLQKLNPGGDGSITPSQIPRSFRLALGRGRASFTRHGGNLVVLPPPDATGLAPEDLGVGPLWFRKMDRNRDGDVSPNEFLGTAEEFRRLDADGDGLISVEEAERADARLRGSPRPRR